MMKDVLFKAKGYDDKWYEGYYVNSFGSHLLYIEDGSKIHIKYDTLCEYIGKEDALGHKIFSYDVINVYDSYNNFLGERMVIWNALDCSWSLIGRDELENIVLENIISDKKYLIAYSGIDLNERETLH